MALETAWTVAQRDRLPRDGNRYEVVGGALFVTPMPSWRHQIIVDELCDQLKPYVREHKLGSAFAVETDVIAGDTSVAVPDIAVYPFTRANLPDAAVDAPRPILVVEVRSPTTWRREIGPKRDMYLALGIPDYWIVDPDERTVTAVRPGREDERLSDTLRWHPAGAVRALEIDVPTLLR